MSGDIIFILTVIYVAYTVYSVVGDEEEGTQAKAKPITDIAELKIQSKVTPQSKDMEKKNQQPKIDAVKQSTRVKNPKPVERNKLTVPKIELRTVMMKNPETGEEAKVANNYRMTKRWVKEALVKEGLLDKIFKNKELDEAAKIKVAEALSMIKAMDKYKV